MSVQFDKQCPVCKGPMANNNKVCSLKCYREGVKQGIITPVEEK